MLLFKINSYMIDHHVTARGETMQLFKDIREVFNLDFSTTSQTLAH